MTHQRQREINKCSLLRTLATIAAIAAALTTSRPVSAGIFGIDYGDNGQDVQTGFTGQLVTTSTNVITNVVDPFGDGDIKVRLFSGGSFEGRNRNGLNATDVNMNNLLDDLVFNASGQSLVLTIGHDNTVVEAGSYEFTAYFNDSFFNSNNNSGGLSGLGVAAYIGTDDGTPDATTLVSDYRSLNPNDPVSTIQLTLVSDGINPLLVTLTGDDDSDGDNRFAFNGFTLSQAATVPEPSSILIWSVLTGVAVVFWSKRRRPLSRRSDSKP